MKRFCVDLMLLVACAALGMWFFFDGEFLDAIIAGLVMLFRRTLIEVGGWAIWRVGIRWLALGITLPLLPILFRRKARHSMKKVREWFIRAWNVVMCHWASARWWLRSAAILCAFMGACAIAVTAGGLLGFLAFLPFQFSAISTAMIGLRAVILRRLSRIAIGYGFSKAVVEAEGFIPLSFRIKFEKRYRHLWMWTMRRLVRSRMVLGRRMAAVVVRNRKK